MDGELDRLEAGGYEEDLRRIIDEVEAAREAELRALKGSKVRARFLAELKAEILRRFEALHPGVRVRFLSGPYKDPDAPPEGPARRKR